MGLSLFATSKRSRRKWIRNLTAQGDVSETTAAQIAWATFPFDDRVRPDSRDFEKAVRSRSWTYLRGAKGIGSMGAAHDAALGTLREMAELADSHGESHYGSLYVGILDGTIPAE